MDHSHGKLNVTHVHARWLDIKNEKKNLFRETL